MNEAYAVRNFIKENTNINGFDLVEKKLWSLFSEDNSKIILLSKGVIKSGGKRIRPLLTLCSCQCISELTNEAIEAGTALEIIHTASLVHDDVIDNSNIRRKTPTINYREGNRVAILCGDYLFALAFEILSKKNLSDIMAVCVKAIKEMCQGEIIQANNKYNWNLSENEYYEKIYKKTGALLAASCECGAYAAGASPETINCFKNYGMNIGYAFQIVDDVLDIVGNEKIIGKPGMRDLLDGDITLPVILLLKDQSINMRIKKLLNGNSIKPTTAKLIQHEIISKGIIDKSLDKARLFVEKAKYNLNTIKNNDYKEKLINIADIIIDREF